MKSEVFITKISSFFPNNPVGNDEMEEYLGLIDGRPSRVKSIILRQNGIKSRYYALDKKSGLHIRMPNLLARPLTNYLQPKKKRVEYNSCHALLPYRTN